VEDGEAAVSGQEEEDKDSITVLPVQATASATKTGET